MTSTICPEPSVKHAIVKKMKELGIERIKSSFSQSGGDDCEIYDTSAYTPNKDLVELDDEMKVYFNGDDGQPVEATLEAAFDLLTDDYADKSPATGGEDSGNGFLEICLNDNTVRFGFSLVETESHCVHNDEGSLTDWVEPDEDEIASSGLKDIHLLTL